MRSNLTIGLLLSLCVSGCSTVAPQTPQQANTDDYGAPKTGASQTPAHERESSKADRDARRRQIKQQAEQDAKRCRKQGHFAVGVFLGRRKGIERQRWHDKIDTRNPPPGLHGTLDAIIDAAYDRPLGSTDAEIEDNAVALGQDAVRSCMSRAMEDATD